MKTYRFRVSIIGIPRLYRIIEASEDCTFDDFHDAIFHAFERFDEHLYSFFITQKDTRDSQTIYDAPEITHPMSVKNSTRFEKKKKSASGIQIGDVGLKEKDVFHYLFDFGDNWWHRIMVQKISETMPKKKHIKLIKSVGESPPQYPEFDEDEEFE